MEIKVRIPPSPNVTALGNPRVLLSILSITIFNLAES